MNLDRAARAAVRSLASLVLIAGALACGGDDDDDGKPGGKKDAGGGGTTPASDDGGDSPTIDGGGTGEPSNGVWPMMGYDERNWYFNPSEKKLTVANAGSLVEKWRYKTGGFPPGTPVVAEGKVIVMATTGTYALELETGAEAWKRTDLGGTASVAYADGFVYVHVYQPPSLYKLDAADGTTVWGPTATNSLAGCTGGSSPIVGGGKVIVGRECGPLEVGPGSAGAKGAVVAINTDDGSEAWVYQTVGDDEDGGMIWSSVGIDVAGGVVYAGSGNNYTMQGEHSDSIHAIDLADGMRNWAQQVRTGDTWSLFGAPTGPDTDFGANPIIADVGGKKVVAAGDKGSAFWSLDRADGTVLWSREQLSVARDQAHGGFLMNGAFDGSTFYGLVNDTSDHSSRLVAMNAAEDGADKFPPKVFPGVYAWAAPSLANGVLVAPVDANVYVLDAADGTELKVIETTGTIAAGAVSIVDGHLLISSGLMYQFDPSAKPNDEVICYGLP
jgi:outer membrane protein assembly factor BamB